MPNIFANIIIIFKFSTINKNYETLNLSIINTETPIWSKKSQETYALKQCYRDIVPSQF